MIAPRAVPLTPVAASDAETSTDTPSVPDVVYSSRDGDVTPPQIIRADLPTPAVAGWNAATNTMEVIVAEDGSVAHVKLVAAPQRMPDVMLLSRAKLWTFAPALKDGRPVRYRMLFSWQVNP